MRNKLSLLIIAILSLSISACDKPGDPEAACNIIPAQDLSKPGVLIIGDSISFGYTPFVKSTITSADIVHTFCNAETSTHGVHWIDRWLAYRDHWSVVTLNHGLWDVPAGTPLSDYSYNLHYEVLKIQAHADHVIFFTTTAVAPGYTIFSNSDIDIYNAAAVDVMNSLGVQVVDLNAVSKTIPELHIDPTNVHFLPLGYKTLADTVSPSIQGLL